MKLHKTMKDNISVKTGRPSVTRAIKIKCWDCICYPHSGQMDCEIPSCPLYYWMPYRELEPDLSWTAEKKLHTKPKKSNLSQPGCGVGNENGRDEDGKGERCP